MEAPGPERRLAAVLAADMVGYSRLMEVDEAGTLARLKTHRLELIDPAIAKNQGRIIKTTGDGLLVEFHSVVDAVTCAVEVQGRMARRNADVSPARWIQFRIGINLGDVIIEDDDIFGDGVNVAARLEGLAEPGGICVSGAVRDQVDDRLDDIAFEDLGEQNVKNITRPIRVFRVRLEPEPPRAPVTARTPRRRQSTTRKPSIAVLPFVNMSGDPEQEFFADGLTEDIITELSRFRDLFVISRNSTFVYKGKAVKVQEVAAKLGVQYVVEGQRAQGRQPRARHRAADRRRDRPARLGRALRPQARGHLRHPGRGDRRDRQPRCPAASRPPRTNARSAKPPTTWPPMSACWPPRCCTTARTRDDNAEAQRLLDRAIELDPELRARPCLEGLRAGPGLGLRLVRGPRGDLAPGGRRAADRAGARRQRQRRAPHPGRGEPDAQRSRQGAPTTRSARSRSIPTTTSSSCSRARF